MCNSYIQEIAHAVFDRVNRLTVKWISVLHNFIHLWLLFWKFVRYSFIHFNIISELERKISVRSTREELIKKGVIKERKEDAIEEGNETTSPEPETSQSQSTTAVTITDPPEQTCGKYLAKQLINQ